MTTYAERLWPPIWLWIVGVTFVLSLAVSFLVALGVLWALVVAAVAGGSLAWGLIASAARVEVVDGHLRAGVATIPAVLLGQVEVLDAQKARAVRGPQSDPAGYHLIRGWVPAGIRAEVTDPADPTPYWFVATRHPAALAAAIRAAQTK